MPKGNTGKRYSETEILKILKEVDAGVSVASTSKKYCVSEGTIHRWKSRYGGLEASELHRMKELEKENLRLR